MRYPQAAASRPSLSIRLAILLPGALALTVATGGFAAAQSLEVHADSLTTYKVAASRVQLVRPLHRQRAVNLDGSLRRGSTFPMAIAGNPYENAWRGEADQQGVRLDTGAWSPTEVDLSFPAPGSRWVIARSYNARQDNSGAYDSNGPSGKNWHQLSQPEIVFYDDADSAKDLVYLVFGADRYVEFKRTGSSNNEFKATNGAAGVFQYTSGSPDTYTLTDTQGVQYAFFGFNTSSARGDGNLWTITDLAGIVAYVGSTTASDATGTDSNKRGWDDAGRILKAVDTAGRRYSYTYTNDAGSTPRLTQVKVETKTGGSWEAGTASGVVEVGKVDYTYYGDESYGDTGALKTAKVTLPLSDSGINEIRTTYYRYWEGAFNASTNPGHPHALKLVVGAEGARKYEYLDSNFADDDLFAETTDNLKPYASAYFEYDSSHQIKSAWFNGQCGCSGAATGTHTYRYETNGSFSNTSGYDTTWERRTSVTRPDTSWVTQYFDELGQPLHRVITDADPANTSPYPSKWVDRVVRDSLGGVTEIGTPANLNQGTYVHSSATIQGESSTGLVWAFTRSSSGNNKGFATTVQFKKGTGGSAYYERTLAYEFLSKTITSATLLRPLGGDDMVYEWASTSPAASDELFTDIVNTGRSSPNEVSLQERSTTLEAVPTAENGANATDTSKVHFALDGTVDFEKDLGGHITYREYSNGLVSKLIADADTTKTAAGEDFNGITIPSGFSSSGTPLHSKTTSTYDAQGRLDTQTLPDARVTKAYHSTLADRRLVTIRYPKYVSGTGTFHGPADYAVRNQAGKSEVQGVIAVTGGSSTAAQTAHIDETDADPITAVDTGSTFGVVAQMRTSIYDEAGTTLEEERAYFVIPSSGAGTDSANYDPTKYGYDDSGRRRRVKEAHPTITRTVYDARGQVTQRWVGTNDYSFAGGETSGTDDMVKSDETEYDLGADDGNGLVTKRTRFVEDSTSNRRDTSFSYDFKGNLLLVTNPVAPHLFHELDNRGRVRVTGSYSSTASIVVGTDVPSTETTNRFALTKTDFDERGQAWKSTRHKIDAADGSDDDNLQTLSWFDAEGQLTKRDGEQLEKFKYDRLGRQSHNFVLALVDADEDTWAEAQDVVSDIVFEEHQTTFDTDGAAIMEATISRFYSDQSTGQTTGALDTNADADALAYTAANVKGRIQITAQWYDALDRLEDVVQYGTNDSTANVATFDRDGLPVPTRSDTELRTTYVYNTDGTLQQLTDPKDLKTRYEYDALGRRTKVIANYVDGSPSSLIADDDQTVVYEYVDGLQSKIKVDQYGTSDDQETLYIFSTTKGTPSRSLNATGHAQRASKYPDSTNSGTTTAHINSDDADVVSSIYDVLDEELSRKDQAGNVIDTTYDNGGRVTVRKASTVASGFDATVRRIETAYDSLGRIETVTQYDAVSAGNVIDQVKYEFDGWGNLTSFKQDRDSTVGASGYWEVAYQFEKATTGRNTLRRTQVTLPGGTVYKYFYRSNASNDADASRVSVLRDVADTDLVSYQYNGVGHVVRTNLVEPALYSKLYTTTATTFGRIDRFDRMDINVWTKDLATDRDFARVNLTYDRNSNITVQNDTLFSGHDVSYTNDNLNRLTRALEGTWSGGSLNTPTRDQQWTLTQTGNWELDKVDLNGDTDFVDASELNDDRTHNTVNELTARDTDDNGTDNFAFTYDAAGNMTDDGETYKYEWDPFGRLRKVKNQSNALVSEYWYNGLGFLITRHQDTDTDGDVDGSDKKYHTAFDERWRPVATFRDSDTDPKEQFLYHAAGAGGFGGSSYIDLVVLRDRDMTNGWTGAADGALEERIYYCQNWRADVVALVGVDGAMKEWVKYSAYGIPFGMPMGDCDSDGDCDSADDTIVSGWSGVSYDVRGDTNLDGTVNATDVSAVSGGHQSLGRGVMTASGIGNRKGSASRESNGLAGSLFLEREGGYSASLGRQIARNSGYATVPNSTPLFGETAIAPEATNSAQLANFQSPPVAARNEEAMPCIGCVASVEKKKITAFVVDPNTVLCTQQSFRIFFTGTPAPGALATPAPGNGACALGGSMGCIQSTPCRFTIAVAYSAPTAAEVLIRDCDGERTMVLPATSYAYVPLSAGSYYHQLMDCGESTCELEYGIRCKGSTAGATAWIRTDATCSGCSLP